MVRAGREGILAVFRGEDARDAVDLDGQGAGHDVEVLPLPGMEVGWRFLAGGLERF